MKRSSYGLAFYCRESKVGKKGTSSIELSLSINGERTFIALPRKMKPSEFNKDFNSKRMNPTREFCLAYERKVNTIISELVSKGDTLSSVKIKACLLNGTMYTSSLKTLIKEYLDIMKEKTKNEITYGAYRRYELCFNEFVKEVGNKDINDVTNGDILLFRTKMASKLKGSTLYGYMARLKTLFKYAQDNGKIKLNPMASIKTPKAQKKIEILTEEEYNKIKGRVFDIPRLEKVRLMWLLGANTGLAYCDLMLLQPSDIKECDGKMYIEKERKKTSVVYTSVVLPDGVEILKRYNNDISDLKISNQKLNGYLLEIQNICGVSHRLTMHTGRHRYATELIRKGVPIAIVQRAMGHSSIQTTISSYTHLTTENIVNKIDLGLF